MHCKTCKYEFLPVKNLRKHFGIGHEATVKFRTHVKFVQAVFQKSEEAQIWVLVYLKLRNSMQDM